MAPLNLERQIHKACGDIHTACTEAVALLGVGAATGGQADALDHAISCVNRAKKAAELLGQMVGTPEDRRQPWSWYRQMLLHSK